MFDAIKAVIAREAIAEAARIVAQATEQARRINEDAKTKAALSGQAVADAIHTAETAARKLLDDAEVAQWLNVEDARKVLADPQAYLAMLTQAAQEVVDAADNKP